MKKKVVFGILIAIVLVALFINCIQPWRTTMMPSKIKATWLWHTEQIQQKPDELLKFLSSQKVTTVFLQINQDIPVTDYESFIGKAANKNISVHALGGSSSWLSGEKGKIKRTAFFNWIEMYQESVEPEARFTGMHLDVEPYIKDSWKDEYAETVAAYQTVLTEGKQLTETFTMDYGLDIPFWFDNRFYDNEFGQGVLSEWLIDIADQVTIMAYRDQAEGNNGILQLIKEDLVYAEQVEKSILIGIETLKSSEGDYLSFYQKKKSTMNHELIKIEKALVKTSSFEGFAIHSIDGWMRMK